MTEDLRKEVSKWNDALFGRNQRPEKWFIPLASKQLVYRQEKGPAIAWDKLNYSQISKSLCSAATSSLIISSMNGLLVYPLWVAFDCGHAPLHLTITKTINYKKILLSRELPSSRLGFQWLSMRQHNYSVLRRGHLPGEVHNVLGLLLPIHFWIEDKWSGSSRHSLFDIKDMIVFCLYSVVVRESNRAFLVKLFKRRKVGWAILPSPTETTTSLVPRKPPHAEIISLPFFGIFIK